MSAATDSTLHRWLEGREQGTKVYPPVIRPEATGSRSLTWAEFVEAALLRQYRREHQVPLQEIREFISALRAETGVPYPLDILGLGKLISGLRPDCTFPGDPGAVIHKRQRRPCSVTCRQRRTPTGFRRSRGGTPDRHTGFGANATTNRWCRSSSMIGSHLPLATAEPFVLAKPGDPTSSSGHVLRVLGLDW